MTHSRYSLGAPIFVSASAIICRVLTHLNEIAENSLIASMSSANRASDGRLPTPVTLSNRDLQSVVSTIGTSASCGSRFRRSSRRPDFSSAK